MELKYPPIYAYVSEVRIFPSDLALNILDAFPVSSMRATRLAFLTHT